MGADVDKGPGGMGRTEAKFGKNEQQTGRFPDIYRELHETAPVGYLVLDAENHIIDVNISGAKLLGAPREDLINRKLTVFVANRFEDAFRVCLEEIQESQQWTECQTEIVRTDGSKFFAAIQGREISDTKELVLFISDLTKARQAEDALRDSERKYRDVADLLAEGVYEADGRGLLSYANLKLRDSLGIDEADFNRTPVFEFIAVSDRDLAKERFARIVRGEDLGPQEYLMQRKDGETFPALIHSLALMREGQLVGIRGAVFDISERKRSESAIQESERKYRELAELLGSGVFEADLNGVVTYSNKKGLALFGLDENDLKNGLNVFDVIVPTDLDLARKNFARVLEKEDIGATEYMVRRKDGSIFPGLTYTSPIIREDLVLGVRGVIVDISVLKRTEQALKESEKKYRELTDLLDEAVFELDADGKFTYSNRKGLSSLGMNENDFARGLTVFDVVAPQDLKRAQETLKAALTEGDSGAVEFQMVRKNGTTFPAITHGSAIVRDGVAVGIRGVVFDISDLKKTEQALKESERKYRELTDLLDEGVFEIDLNGKVSYANRKGLSYLGLTDDDFKAGINAFEIVAPQDHELSRERFSRVLQQEDIGAVEYLMNRKDGTTFPALVHSSAIIQEDKVVGLRSVLFDISNIKRAEQALKESEKKYRELADLLDEGVYEVDPGGRITYANRKGLSYLGLSEDDLKNGVNGFELFVDENMDVVKERFTRLLNGEDIGAVEYTWRRKDGTTFPALTHSSAVIRDGEVVGVRGVIVDISDLKNAERALRESEGRFRTFVSSLHEGIWVLDKEDITTFVNPRMAEMLGYSEKEMLGKPVYSFNDEEWKKFTIASLERRKQGVSEQLEGELLRKDGGRVYALLEASPILDANGNYAGSIAGVQDITERKVNEEKLKRAMAELDRSNKELEQFAYVTSHDLREPLRMMTGFSQLLEKRYKDKLDSTANEYIDFIVDGAARMQRLIDDILVYSRVSTRGLPFEQVEMDTVVQEVLLNLKAAVDENDARITSDPLPQIQADPTQMKQVLQNLIANAIKFHKEGEPPVIKVSARREGGEWLFSVRDNGIGMDPELFGRLFILFQRLHPQDKYPGTGVGLAVAKKIVQRHGGRIWVESKPGEGSVFYFTVPLIMKREQNARE